MATLSIKQSNRWSMFAKAFLYIFITLGFSSIVLFHLVKLCHEKFLRGSVIRYRWFYIIFRFDPIDEHPYLFLLCIVLISSIVGAIWLVFSRPLSKRKLPFRILTIPWISLLITSPFFGLIWSYYYWPPEVFNSKAVMWQYYLSDMRSGLMSGWFIAIESFPMNITSYIAFCLILWMAYKRFQPQKKEME
jgi:hypothetical protein